jgi:hypothetical protein
MFCIVIFFLHEKKCGISTMDHELWKWTIQFIQWFINDELWITYEIWWYIYYELKIHSKKGILNDEILHICQDFQN